MDIDNASVTQRTLLRMSGNASPFIPFDSTVGDKDFAVCLTLHRTFLETRALPEVARLAVFPPGVDPRPDPEDPDPAPVQPLFEVPISQLLSRTVDKHVREFSNFVFVISEKEQ